MNTFLSIAVYADERSDPSEETAYCHGEAYGYEAAAECAARAFVEGSSPKSFVSLLSKLMVGHTGEPSSDFDKGALAALEDCAQLLAS